MVIVMDGGLAAEFDHPFNLLKNVDGFFYKMVEDTGRSTADALHGLAVEVKAFVIYSRNIFCLSSHVYNLVNVFFFIEL